MIVYYILIISLPLVSHPLFGKSIGGITVLKYLGTFCMLYAGFYALAKRRSPKFLASGQARAFLAFILLAIISHVALGEFPFSRSIISIYISNLAFFIVTLILVDSYRRLRFVLLAAIGSIGWASLYILKEWLGASSVYGPDYRPGYVAGDPNFFTASAVLGLPLALYFITENEGRWERVFSIGCVVVTLPAIMVCASRSGFLGLVAALLTMVWHSPKRLRILFLIGTLLSITIAVSPSTPLRRLLHPTHSDVSSTANRIWLWKAGLNMIREHPLIGVGLNNFGLKVESYGTPEGGFQGMAHNAYLEMTAEMGFPGLLAFSAMLFFAFRSLSQTRRQAIRAEAPLVCLAARGTYAGLIGFAVASFFVSTQFLKLFWFLIFLSACLPPLLPPPSTDSDDPLRPPSAVFIGRERATPDPEGN